MFVCTCMSIGVLGFYRFVTVRRPIIAVSGERVRGREKGSSLSMQQCKSTMLALIQEASL